MDTELRELERRMISRPDDAAAAERYNVAVLRSRGEPYSRLTFANVMKSEKVARRDDGRRLLTGAIDQGSCYLDLIESVVMNEIRADEPKTRARGIIFYSRSTSATKELSCKICGEVVTTWCSQYPQTLQASLAAANHRTDCLTQWAEKVTKRSMKLETCPS